MRVVGLPTQQLDPQALSHTAIFATSQPALALQHPSQTKFQEKNPTKLTLLIQLSYIVAILRP